MRRGGGGGGGEEQERLYRFGKKGITHNIRGVKARTI